LNLRVIESLQLFDPGCEQLSPKFLWYVSAVRNDSMIQCLNDSIPQGCLFGELISE